MITLKVKQNEEAKFVEKHCLPITFNSKFALELQDDVAFLNGEKRSKIIIKTDSISEGIHYKIGTKPLKIGHKLLARNLSDIAAKGGIPLGFTLSIFRTKSTNEAFLEDFLTGIKALARDFSLPLIGGDEVSVKNNFFSASITIFATKNGKISERKNAKVGDFIYITGQIGRAFLGFEGEANFLPFFETPAPQINLMQELFAKYKINASIDISDGFLKDLNTLLFVSQKGAYVDCSKIPTPKTNHSLEKLLTFGDDYQILFTSKDEISHKDVRKIGVILKEKHLQLEGLSQIPENFGYNHY
jgi:thiamine-monophosphate kinase